MFSSPANHAKSFLLPRVDRALFILALSFALQALSTAPLLAGFTAVPTFESIGLYWAPEGGSERVTAKVHYREVGQDEWREGHPLWYAPAEADRPAEYRGSIVLLKPGTTYEVKLTLETGFSETQRVTTWSEEFPVARVIQVTDRSTPLEIQNVHGSPDGYILYTGPAIIDVDGAYPYNIRIQDSSYIIIRGLTLRGATGDGILLGSSTARNASVVHDIVIEENDISNWGSVDPDAPPGMNWGRDRDSGIRSSSTMLERIIIQRNRIHSPRTDANSWKEDRNLDGTGNDHPRGPQGITLEYGTKGNFVIRYNEIVGDNEHRFNDGMGATQNFGYGGFPIRDSDIYGNYIAFTWDDAIEVEGANMNVRVWGNVTDETYVGIAMAGTTLGPLYVFRNVFQRSRTGPAHAYGGVAFKRGGSSQYPSDGRIYLYNNTMFFAGNPTYQTGVAERTDANFSRNTVGRNNILIVRGNANDRSVHNRDPGSSFDYDLYNGLITSVNPEDEARGVKGYPRYVSGAGLDRSTMTGIFQLLPESPGYDAGVVIPNFTDDAAGAAPDIGAHEADTPPMEFGVNAYRNQ